ncbi:MAG: TIGR02556 family CRISPR-associated protein [candidate division WOR-3 bacterium]|nr:TIGR02556 family CRISPR-associated protein [Candidatus Omnitrophota bacterium]
MLEAIKKLGEIKIKKEGKDVENRLSILIQNPNQDGKYPKVLLAVFVKKDDGSYEYKEIRIEDFSLNKLEKYLYRRYSSNGPDFTLTSKITEAEKFYNNKIKSWFRNYGNKNELFTKLNNAFHQWESEIRGDLEEKYKDAKASLKKKGCFFTLAIEEKGQLRYIGDYDEFKKFFVDIVTEKYKEIEKEKQIYSICSICGREKEVYGDALSKVFKFYTLDKPGYIAGGFRKENAWKNAPLCLDCILKLEEGKKYLDENLKKRLGGHEYYLIPKFMIEKEENNQIIDTFFGKFPNPKDEEEILEELANIQNILTYNFLFFDSRNPQVFRIELYIEDVLPSRVKEIDDKKKEIEKIFENIKIKEDKYQNIKFSFRELRKFVPSQKFYFEILYKIFKNENINREMIFSCFMEKIREEFTKENYLTPLVLQAFISFLFFQKLNILYPKTEYYEEGGEFMNELEKSMEEFFNKYRYSDTFSQPIHKAIFLLGVLTQKLLDIQYAERKTTPFRKYLKGLRMSKEDIIELFPRVRNKLDEYGKNYYRNLETLISHYFCKAGREWKISLDEINFYFVLGMSLAEKVLEDLRI